MFEFRTLQHNENQNELKKKITAHKNRRPINFTLIRFILLCWIFYTWHTVLHAVLIFHEHRFRSHILFHSIYTSRLSNGPFPLFANNTPRFVRSINFACVRDRFNNFFLFPKKNTKLSGEKTQPKNIGEHMQLRNGTSEFTVKF